MKHKRRYSAPDGLDWRDENMPVLRYGKINNVQGYHMIKPESITEYYYYKMRDPNYNPPLYQNDPSYWWNRRNRK